MVKRLKFSQIIQRLRDFYDDKYIMITHTFENTKSFAIFYCKDHGQFKAKIYDIIRIDKKRRKQCPGCSRRKINKNCIL